MKPVFFGVLAAAAVAALSSAAHAERAWLLPSATTFSGDGAWVTFDAANSSELFYPDHRPLPLDDIRVWRPDGSEGKIENALTGRRRSTFEVQLDEPGTWKIGMETSMVVGSYMLGGEEHRVGRGRPTAVSVEDIPAQATDVKLTEIVSRNEVYVTDGAPTTTVFAPTGKGIELQPVTHPDELVKGETAIFRFLVDGAPAGGIPVTVVPGGKRYRDLDEARSFTTAADGTVRIDWPEAGMYWIHATLTDGKPSEPKAAQRRMNYMTTVEVLLP
jgi:hypothetical protein